MRNLSRAIYRSSPHGPLTERRAFSLIEIVLALGVIAFALVGIMGLFPVAMKSAQESQRETRAALIARQIFSDLRASSGTNRLLTTGSNTAALNLSTSTAIAFAYDETLRAVGPVGDFSNAITIPGALFAANVTVQTNTGTPNLSQVQVNIETPVTISSGNRSRYSFVTLVNY